MPYAGFELRASRTPDRWRSNRLRHGRSATMKKVKGTETCTANCILKPMQELPKNDGPIIHTLLVDGTEALLLSKTVAFDRALSHGVYGAAPKCKSRGNLRSPRKPAEQRHRLSRLPPAKIRERPFRESNPVRLGGRRVVCCLTTTQPCPPLRDRCIDCIKIAGGVAVAERLDNLPPAKANRVQSPAWPLPDFHMWESCRTMPLVGGFPRGSPVSPAPSFRRCFILTSITLINPQDLIVCGRLFEENKMSEENKIEKLTGEDNYTTWRIIMQVCLECNGLFDVVDGALNKPEDIGAACEANLGGWMRAHYEGDMCARLLQTFPQDFDHVYVSWHDLPAGDKTWAKLQKRLLNYEWRIKVRDGQIGATDMFSILKRGHTPHMTRLDWYDSFSYFDAPKKRECARRDVEVEAIGIGGIKAKTDRGTEDQLDSEFYEGCVLGKHRISFEERIKKKSTYPRELMYDDVCSPMEANYIYDCGYRVHFLGNQKVVCRDVKFRPPKLCEPRNFVEVPSDDLAESTKDERLEESSDEDLIPEERVVEDSEEGYRFRDRKQIKKPTSSQIFEQLYLLKEVPSNYQEALQSDDASKWKEAIDEKINSLYQNRTWQLMNKPPNHRVVGNRWVYAVMYNSNNYVNMYKARLVAKGYSQHPGVNYFDTFSPVAHFETVRALLANALQCEWDIELFYVKTAFLHGQLDEDVFMRQPMGCEDGTQCVCKLLSSLYGLKQTSKCWHKCLTDYLRNCSLEESNADPCMYHCDDMMISFHVYDGLIMADNYLGLQIKITENSIEVNQFAYDEKILQKLGFMDYKHLTLPVAPGWEPRNSHPAPNVELFLKKERMSVDYIPYEEQSADILTKGLCFRKLQDMKVLFGAKNSNRSSDVCSLAVAPVLLHIWKYGIPFLFPCTSSIGAESSRVCLINSDPIAKVTSVFAHLKSILSWNGREYSMEIVSVSAVVGEPPHEARQKESAENLADRADRAGINAAPGQPPGPALAMAGRGRHGVAAAVVLAWCAGVASATSEPRASATVPLGYGAAGYGSAGYGSGLGYLGGGGFGGGALQAMFGGGQAGAGLQQMSSSYLGAAGGGGGDFAAGQAANSRGQHDAGHYGAAGGANNNFLQAGAVEGGATYGQSAVLAEKQSTVGTRNDYCAPWASTLPCIPFTQVTALTLPGGLCDMMIYRSRNNSSEISQLRFGPTSPETARQAIRPPTEATRIQFPMGSLPIFVRVNRDGPCHCEVSMEQCRNARSGETGDPRENLLTSHDSHTPKPGSDSARNRILATIELSICHVAGTGARTRDPPPTSRPPYPCAMTAGLKLTPMPRPGFESRASRIQDQRRTDRLRHVRYANVRLKKNVGPTHEVSLPTTADMALGWMGVGVRGEGVRVLGRGNARAVLKTHSGVGVEFFTNPHAALDATLDNSSRSSSPDGLPAAGLSCDDIGVGVKRLRRV
ncbi:hypothetical protein PR048_012022 [Dryococelus australis]|uniref:Reverse transcriptase Ty1/copia-type domain-containing protein n=1 Tax=Dryococelus australis TaxID=614101 RepID=A0ABQ9HNI8_9NEOP|nr:hypothetical protein PR048_012022 [Dryococelus australis]